MATYSINNNNKQFSMSKIMWRIFAIAVFSLLLVAVLWPNWLGAYLIGGF